MPDVPPDPRSVINARIHHFKKQSQKLNLESLEAEADLERAKQAVRQGRPSPKAVPTPRVVSVTNPTAGIPRPSAVIAIRPFASGVGYALTTENVNLWFSSEDSAINYAREVFPQSSIEVLNADGTTSVYGPSAAPENS